MQTTRIVLLGLIVTFAMGLSGIFSSANAQSNISCCKTKKGKLRNCEFGENPRKECRSAQTLIKLPITTKTDELGETTDDLKAKVERLISCFSTERYLDLGLTAFDCKTWLEWEKKVEGAEGSCLDDDKLHSVDATCTWNDATDHWLAKLNASPCFAEKCDWRLPEVGVDGKAPELESIVDCSGSGSACIAPIFGPTKASFYWSSVSGREDSDFAWTIDFANGALANGGKAGRQYIRAMRPGP